MHVNPKDETSSDEEMGMLRKQALEPMLETPPRPHKPTGLTPLKVKAPKKSKP